MSKYITVWLWTTTNRRTGEARHTEEATFYDNLNDAMLGYVEGWPNGKYDYTIERDGDAVHLLDLAEFKTNWMAEREAGEKWRRSEAVQR